MLFDTLIDDVVLDILLELSVKDIVSIRLTSKRLASLTRVATVWRTRLAIEVVDAGIPLPGTPVNLATLSGEHLEWRVLHALRLEKRWRTSATLSTTHVDIPNTHGPVDELILIKGGEVLLMRHGGQLVYWALGASTGPAVQVREVAAWTCPGVNISVHRDSSHFDRLAIVSQDYDFSKVSILKVGGFDQGSPPFAEIGAYRHRGRLAALRDSQLYFQVSDGFQVVQWPASGEGDLYLTYPPGVFDVITAMSPLSSIHFLEHHFLVFWRSLLAVFEMRAVHEPVVEDDTFVPIAPVQIFSFLAQFAMPLVFSSCMTDGPNGGPLTVMGSNIHGTGILQSVFYSLPVSLGQPSSSEQGEQYTLDLALRARGMLPLQHGLSALCVGPSGRGVCIDGQMLLRARPTLLMDFMTSREQTMAEFHPRAWRLTCVKRCGPVAAFDEGMGRLVLNDEAEPGRVVLVDFI